MLKRSFTFTNFIEAFIFVSRVTVHAEVLKHHPDLLLSYGKVKITLTTHSLKGLTNVDFDLAKKIDALDLSTKSKR
jgi:4a-hydroxytetrahydrobiopterin dehydratase